MNFKNLSKKTLLNSAALLSTAILFSACATKTAENQYGNGASDTGGIGLGTLERVHFDYDSSVLSANAAKVLNKHGKQLKANKKTKVLIEGHTDNRGTDEYNIALGERRAKVALDHLVATGVDRTQLEMKSWGEEKALDMGTSNEAFKLNRRDEFVIIDK